MLNACCAIACALLLIFFEVEATANQDGAARERPTHAQQTADGAAGAGQEIPRPHGRGYLAQNRDVFLEADPETDTLTRDWFGLGDDLRDHGVTSTLNLWVIYQGNVTGGLQTGDEASGLYWFANHFDLERLVGLPGAAAYVLVEGGWGNGINPLVGSLVNVDGSAIGDEPIGVTRLWYDQSLFDQRLRLRLGKIDVTTDNFEFHGRSVAFDAMPYGNSPRTQFLDSGLMNNPSVPFPAAALAGMMLVEPVKRLYVAATVIDRKSDAFDWSYAGAFDDWMVAAETGVVAPLLASGLTGSYYIGYWHSTFPGSPYGQGVYAGLAQDLYREPGAKEQGFAVFARYGWSDSNPNGIRNFWSVGAQYLGLVPGRNDDILALGWSQAFIRGPRFSAFDEGALEFYYRARLGRWLHISPHIQYISHPGSAQAGDAVTLGVRGQVTF